MDEYRAQYEALLDEMDGLLDDNNLSGNAREALTELAAEFEDALMLLPEAEAVHPDEMEDLRETLETLLALGREYRALEERFGADKGIGARIEEISQRAAETLESL